MTAPPEVTAAPQKATKSRMVSAFHCKLFFCPQLEKVTGDLAVNAELQCLDGQQLLQRTILAKIDFQESEWIQRGEHLAEALKVLPLAKRFRQAACIVEQLHQTESHHNLKGGKRVSIAQLQGSTFDIWACDHGNANCNLQPCLIQCHLGT